MTFPHIFGIETVYKLNCWKHCQLPRPTHNIFNLNFFVFFWFDVRILHTAYIINKWFSEKMWNIHVRGFECEMKIEFIKNYVYLFNLLKIFNARSQFSDCFIRRDRKSVKSLLKLKNGLAWLCDFFFSFTSSNHYFISINLLMANFLWHLVLDWYLS